jgi:hypothetical protein
VKSGRSNLRRKRKVWQKFLKKAVAQNELLSHYNNDYDFHNDSYNISGFMRQNSLKITKELGLSKKASGI